jgi:hypothetical protein
MEVVCGLRKCGSGIGACEFLHASIGRSLIESTG